MTATAKLPPTSDPRYGDAGIYAGIPMWAGLEDDDDVAQPGTYEGLWMNAHHPDGRPHLRAMVIDQAKHALAARARDRKLPMPDFAG